MNKITKYGSAALLGAATSVGGGLYGIYNSEEFRNQILNVVDNFPSKEPSDNSNQVSKVPSKLPNNGSLNRDCSIMVDVPDRLPYRVVDETLTEITGNYPIAIKRYFNRYKTDRLQKGELLECIRMDGKFNQVVRSGDDEYFYLPGESTPFLTGVSHNSDRNSNNTTTVYSKNRIEEYQSIIAGLKERRRQIEIRGNDGTGDLFKRSASSDELDEIDRLESLYNRYIKEEQRKIK